MRMVATIEMNGIRYYWKLAKLCVPLKLIEHWDVETSVANNSPSQDSLTQMIIFNQGMLLLGSNHLLMEVWLNDKSNDTLTTL